MNFSFMRNTATCKTYNTGDQIPDWLKDTDVEGAIIGGETKSGDQAQFKDV